MSDERYVEIPLGGVSGAGLYARVAPEDYALVVGISGISIRMGMP